MQTFDQIIIAEKITTQANTTLALYHNYHEFIFIDSGNGFIDYENLRLPFSTAEVFLIRKDIKHELYFTAATTVFFVRFCEKSRLKLKTLSKNSEGAAEPPQKTKSPLNKKVTLDSDDYLLVKLLFEMIVALCKEVKKNENIIYYQLISLVNITERNLTLGPIQKELSNEKTTIIQLIKFIHRNIQEPENLTLQHLSDEFNLSLNRLGILFKNETGLTIKQFITASRMELVATRISNSEMSFSEIAFDFGFVDESHLNKVFKKQYGQTPSDYRKNHHKE